MSEMQQPQYSFVPEFTLGDRLRRSREAVGLTQTELADIAGFSQRSVSNYEADVTVPALDRLRAWADACQVNLAWLAYGVLDSPPPSTKNWAVGRRRVTRAVTSGYQTMSQPAKGDDNRLITAA